MSTLTSGNNIVDAVACMQFTGNIIPQRWYKNILKDTGKPDLLAIVLLADIVYWYRPKEERDETTGQLIGFRTKFHNDFLQRDYIAFAEQFGESKRNIRDAMARLEKLGVIRREFRTIITPSGVRCSNVLFVELIPKKLHEITHDDLPMTQKSHRVDVEETEVLRKNATPNTQSGSIPLQNYVIGHTQKRKTNTENIAKNTTKINSSSSQYPFEDDELKKRIGFVNAMETYGDIAKVIYEELCKDGNQDVVKTITKQFFAELCKNISQYASPIYNLGAYIRTCLSNMAAGQKIKHRNAFSQHLQGDYDIAELEEKILAN